MSDTTTLTLAEVKQVFHRISSEEISISRVWSASKMEVEKSYFPRSLYKPQRSMRLRKAFNPLLIQWDPKSA